MATELEQAPPRSRRVHPRVVQAGFDVAAFGQRLERAWREIGDVHFTESNNTTLRSVLLGSETAKVLAHSMIPVLVMP